MNRIAEVRRDTKETQIRVRVDLDGTGAAKLATGIGFFDHMLDQIARHGLIDLDVEARGDLLATAHTIAASVGSACHSDADAVSGVLAAMGCDAARARGAVRLSVGFPTSLREIELAAAALIDAWRQTEK